MSHPARAVFTRIVLASSLLSITAIMLSCVSSNESATVPPSASADQQYAPVLKRWFRDIKVFSEFQNRVEMSAVLLTNEMRRAVTERLSRLRGASDGLSVLSDTSGGVRLGVLVSVFTPDEPYMTLDDRTLWSLSMRIGPSQMTPMYIRQISDKTLLRSFFPSMHRWSQDYLMVFDYPETILQPESDDQKGSLEAEFIAQSAIAKVELRWP